MADEDVLGIIYLIFFFSHLYGIDFTRRRNDVASRHVSQY
jgi:hypothetical protein